MSIKKRVRISFLFKITSFNETKFLTFCDLFSRAAWLRFPQCTLTIFYRPEIGSTCKWTIGRLSSNATFATNFRQRITIFFKGRAIGYLKFVEVVLEVLDFALTEFYQAIKRTWRVSLNFFKM
jgi:hypothetical protein